MIYLEEDKQYKRLDGTITTVKKTKFKGCLAYQAEDGFYYTMNGFTNDNRKQIISEAKVYNWITKFERVVWITVLSIVGASVAYGLING